MAKVLKYEMPRPGKAVAICFPTGFSPVSVQMQHGKIMLWAEVPDVGACEDAVFHTIGTGWGVPDKTRHVGTVQDDGFVWHVYRSAA